MTTLDEITDDDKRKRILEYINLMKDEKTADFMKKIYSARCEILLFLYKGNDYELLFNNYLMSRK